jgi:hypothetical protein
LRRLARSDKTVAVPVCDPEKGTVAGFFLRDPVVAIAIQEREPAGEGFRLRRGRQGQEQDKGGDENCFHSILKSKAFVATYFGVASP